MRVAFVVSAAAVQQVPRHSEVDQESPTGFEPNNQIFATAIDGGDTFPLQFGPDLEGLEGTRQSRIENLDALEAAADERGLEAPANRLDLRKLGHPASVVRAAGLAEDVEYDGPLRRRLIGDLVRSAKFDRGLVGSGLRCGVDLGERLAGRHPVPALAEAEDPNGVVDRVVLGAAACAQVQRRLADRDRAEGADVALALGG